MGRIDIDDAVWTAQRFAQAPAHQQATRDRQSDAMGEPDRGHPDGHGPARTVRAGSRDIINGTAPVTPFTVFQNTRGATFTTPGTGLTQAAATRGLLSLDLSNPQYAALFAPFSPNRLFAPIGSNITDGFFSIPGTGGTVPAGVSGFGVVFSDVDLAGTSIAFATTEGITGDQTSSFLGLSLDPAEGLITSVRIITGTTALGPSEGPGVDLVVMDDFLSGEPQAIIPLPGTVALLGVGLLACGLVQVARANGPLRSHRLPERSRRAPAGIVARGALERVKGGDARGDRRR